VKGSPFSSVSATQKMPEQARPSVNTRYVLQVAADSKLHRTRNKTSPLKMRVVRFWVAT